MTVTGRAQSYETVKRSMTILQLYTVELTNTPVKNIQKPARKGQEE